MWFPPFKTVFLHYFDHYNVTNGHFAWNCHAQKLLKLFHDSMYILGCCEEQFYSSHVHVGRTKYDFPPPRLYFYTILLIVTSQMVILIKNFHNSMYILGCCEEQFYGNHAHLARTKYDFPPPRLYFYTILTIMTSQMTILLKRAILK